MDRNIYRVVLFKESSALDTYRICLVLDTVGRTGVRTRKSGLDRATRLSTRIDDDAQARGNSDREHFYSAWKHFPHVCSRTKLRIRWHSSLGGLPPGSCAINYNTPSRRDQGPLTPLCIAFPVSVDRIGRLSECETNGARYTRR
ncbi:hypothetical protein KQX54_021395 [Cotesia glomerata]|uniref:Uncharacterized protein n=1 Tax=Cotesia glomerata TaxID=32391 RepID=A0AAV7J6M2_COTGL|nr:hypothetical protein KQX54_021395 [Cotesia glomerata]